jgi:hypothetical protein
MGVQSDRILGPAGGDVKARALPASPETHAVYDLARMATLPGEAPQRDPEPAPPAARALVLLPVAVTLAYLGAMLSATEGHFVPQVSDLYLVCQYARAMAEGHPFRYNPGEAPTTGATSPLHTALLALGHAVGFRGEGLIAFAVLTGAAFYAVTVLMAVRIGARLGDRREAVLAGLLVALGGPVVWGFLYGADVALAMMLATWLLERVVSGWSRGALGWVLPAALFALTRPEALAAVLILAVAYVLGPGARAPRRGGVFPWIPVAAGAALLVLYRFLTGSWLGSSVADKSLLANYSLTDALALVTEYLVDLARGLLLGFYPRQSPIGVAQGFAPYYFPPLALVLIVLAVALAPPRARVALRVWCATVAVLFLAVAPNVFAGVHFNRYLMWAFPGLLALTAVGLGVLVRDLVRLPPEQQQRLFVGVAAVFVALGGLATLRFAAVYADMAGQVNRRDAAAAHWIRQNLPPGARIANLATSVEYLTGHHAVNLHGVTSAAFFGNRTAEREADTFEALGRLPEAERPEYLLSTASTQAALPTMRELVVEPPLFQTTSHSDELVLYRMRYDIVGRNARPYLARSAAAVQGMSLVDRLNVCDTADERAHRHRFVSRLGDLRLFGAARIDDYEAGLRVADGGRVVLGSESFDVATTPGRDLLVLLRTSGSATANVLRPQEGANFALELREAGMAVTVDGRPAQRFTFTPGAGWDEVWFKVPGALVTGPRTRLELRGRYAAYYFWFYQ